MKQLKGILLIVIFYNLLISKTITDTTTVSLYSTSIDFTCPDSVISEDLSFWKSTYFGNQFGHPAKTTLAHAGEEPLSYYTVADTNLSNYRAFYNMGEMGQDPLAQDQQVYFLITTEGFYVKFKFIEYISEFRCYEMEWCLQDDGSPYFTETAITPFSQQTWGDVKKRFK